MFEAGDFAPRLRDTLTREFLILDWERDAHVPRSRDALTRAKAANPRQEYGVETQRNTGAPARKRAGVVLKLEA